MVFAIDEILLLSQNHLFTAIIKIMYGPMWSTSKAMPEQNIYRQFYFRNEICSTCRKYFPVRSSFMNYHRVVTRLTRRVPLVVQELLILPQHLSSPPVCSGVRVTRSLVLCVFFVDRYLYFCTVSFGHCVVCSSIYGF